MGDPVEPWELVYARPGTHSWDQDEPSVALQLLTHGQALAQGTTTGGLAVVGTFAAEGPEHCSGLPVAGYDPDRLTDTLTEASGVRCAPVTTAREEHHTPTGADDGAMPCRSAACPVPACPGPVWGSCISIVKVSARARP
jgi:hypothetical protein